MVFLRFIERLFMSNQPRSGSEQVGGIPWLARMIDKARLEAAGEIDAFDLDYPCPMDRGLLNQLGIDAKTFQRIAVEANSDEAILGQLKTVGANV